jgi:hypothetical protein
MALVMGGESRHSLIVVLDQQLAEAKMTMGLSMALGHVAFDWHRKLMHWQLQLMMVACK